MRLKLLLILISLYSMLSAQQFQWAKSFSGNAAVEILSQDTDAQGNIYSGGYFLGTSDFDPGNEEFLLTSTGSGNFDAFVCKLDPSGNFVYAFSFGGNQNDIVTSLAVNANGEVYVAGNFRSTADFDPGQDVVNLTSNGGLDFFVSKFSPEGQLLWVQTFGGSADDEALDIKLSSDGAILITGIFRNQVDFDPGIGIFNLTGGSFGDAFLLKLNEDGNFIWAKRFGGNLTDQGVSIFSRPNGFILLSGIFHGTMGVVSSGQNINLTSNGGSDIFVLHLNAEAEIIHAVAFGGNQNDFVHQIQLADNGRVYISGAFRNSVDFNPGPGVVERTSNGGNDLFLLALLANLEFDWVFTAGGTGNDRSLGIASNFSGRVYLTGEFNNTISINQSENNIELQSNGGSDALLLELSPTGAVLSASSIGAAGVDYGRSVLLRGNELIWSGAFSETVIFDTINATSLTSDIAIGAFTAKYSICDNQTEYFSISECQSYMFIIPATGVGVLLSNNGTYEIIANLNDGCQIIYLIDFEILQTDLNVIVQDNTLQAITSGEATFQWLDCDNGYAAIAGATDALFTPSQSGTYAVSAVQTACVDTSECFDVFVNRISSTLKECLLLFPNPAKDIVHLKADGMILESISLYDLSGKMLHVPIEILSNGASINTSALKTGMYVIHLILSDGRSKHLRLLKQLD